MGAHRLVGVLVVHGIGKQKRFDTVDKIAAGMASAIPQLQVGPHDDERTSVDLVHPKSDVIVRLYEVYWAELFDEEAAGSFTIEKAQAVAWLPMLNRRDGMYQPPRSRLRIALWTTLLMPLSAVMLLGLFGAQIVAAAVTAFIEAARDASKGRPRQSPWNRFKEIRAGRGVDSDRSWLDKLLDMVVGDVFLYLAGSAPTVPSVSSADRVRERVYRQLDRAGADGCTEINVLAHSLGTVVAFNALTGLRAAEAMGGAPAPRPVALKNIWTIGSPLEKMAFLWPLSVRGEPIKAFAIEGDRVVVARRTAPDPLPTWVNFRNPLDKVSGTLRSFPAWQVRNRRVWAGGILRSHTVYERNGKVLDTLTAALFGTPLATEVPRRKVAAGVVQAALESLAVLLAMALAIFLGLVQLLFMAALVPWITSKLAAPVVSDGVESGILNYGLAFFAFAILLSFLLTQPWQAAVAAHRVWLTPSAHGPKTAAEGKR